MNSVADVTEIVAAAKEAITAQHMVLARTIQTDRDAVGVRTRALAQGREREDGEVRTARQREGEEVIERRRREDEETAARHQREDDGLKGRRAAEDADLAAQKAKILSANVQNTRLVGTLAALNLMQSLAATGVDDVPAHEAATEALRLIHQIWEKLSHPPAPEGYFAGIVESLKKLRTPA